MTNKNTVAVLIIIFFAIVLYIIFGQGFMMNTVPVTGVSTSTPGTINPVVDSSLTQMYTDAGNTYSIHLPQDYTVNNQYQYSLSPEENIKGVSFTIPLLVATGTNLSTDTRISVEQMPHVPVCSGSMFLSTTASASSTVTEGKTTYSKAISGDAAAGNRYEETVYAIKGSVPCTAIRYFVHYGVFENYPSGSIKEFDKAKLISTFDSIRRSLIIAK